MDYIVIYLSETDGNIVIERRNGQEIRDLAKEMSQEEIAILQGHITKNFDTKRDLSQL